MWPAQQAAVDPEGPCVEPSKDAHVPALGHLFRLAITEAELDNHPATRTAPPWVRTILTAMREYGMYVNDNGGYQDGYFQL